MSRLLKLKRQVIAEANKRILGEQYDPENEPKLTIMDDSPENIKKLQKTSNVDPHVSIDCPTLDKSYYAFETNKVSFKDNTIELKIEPSEFKNGEILGLKYFNVVFEYPGLLLNGYPKGTLSVLRGTSFKNLETIVFERHRGRYRFEFKPYILKQPIVASPIKVQIPNFNVPGGKLNIIIDMTGVKVKGGPVVKVGDPEFSDSPENFKHITD
jgi:hypothetical protein